MENYRFADLVRMILASRRAVPYPVPLHLFGAGHPLTMAFSVALGCDTFDSASYVLFARSGRYMTERGIQRLDQMSYLPCSCPSCNSTGLRELQEMESAERTRLLSLHNLYQLKTEVANCKQAIVEGRLWDLVEERAAAHPRVMEAFRAMAENAELLEDGTPALKDRGLFFRGDLDALRPELKTSKARLDAAARRGERKALVVLGEEPLAATYSGRRRPGAKLRGHDLYRVHPCLGVYPAELDFVYPFTQTIAVSTPPEVSESRRNATKALKLLGYRSVAFSTAGPHLPSEEHTQAPWPHRKVVAGSATRRASRPSKSRPRQKARGPSPPSSSARSR
jgi:7-cyano-7-deazaguanine tRNA-ribosyltransferase